HTPSHHCLSTPTILNTLTTSLVTFTLLNHPPTTEIHTPSLHDALPISPPAARRRARTRDSSRCYGARCPRRARCRHTTATPGPRSEEHTSELQSRFDLVCRLLLEKKKNSEI